MALNLSSYDAVQSNSFVRIAIPNYQTLRFSDYHKAFTINSESYTGLGQLISITETSSELRAAPQELTISISGIPAGNIGDILNNRIKGSSVKLYRALFNPTTGALLSLAGNPSGKFQGVVSNFIISDELTSGSDTGTKQLILTCTSVVELLSNKVSGRRTNPLDMKQWYPTDESFDRVPSLAKSNFNFGAPTK
jgi:hypothetical protein